LGLSATPYRKDGKGIVFKSHIGQVLVTSTVMALVPRVIITQSEFRLPRVRVVVKDRLTGKDKYVMAPMTVNAGKTMHINKMLSKNVRRNEKFVRFIKAAYKKGRRTIFFSDLKSHLSDRIYPMLRAVGIPSSDIAYYVGGMKEEAREEAKQKPIILATYKMASMATDIPWLDTCVLGTPRSDVVQIAGRILREYEDKKVPLIFDMVDPDCDLFVGYGRNRLRWYRKIHAEVLKRAS